MNLNETNEKYYERDFIRMTYWVDNIFLKKYLKEKRRRGEYIWKKGNKWKKKWNEKEKNMAILKILC